MLTFRTLRAVQNGAACGAGGWLVHQRCNSREIFGAEGVPGYAPFRL